MYTRPKFIIGEWYRPGELIERSAAEKHNTLLGWEKGGVAALPLHDYMQRALSFNMGVALQITDETLAYCHANQPENMVAWMLPDEPVGKVGFDDCKAMRINAASVMDLPVILDFAADQLDNVVPAVITAYIDAAGPKGITAYDFYPLNYGHGPERIPFHGHLVSLLRGCGARQIMSILECGNIDVSEQDWIQQYPATKAAMRGPTTGEILTQVELCVVELHVEHIAYFPDDIGKGWKGFTDVSPEASAAIAEMNQEIAVYKNGEKWPLNIP